MTTPTLAPPTTPTEAIAEALAELGNTADDVATELNFRDITGERSDPARCPIANFIRGLQPDLIVVVGIQESEIRGPGADACFISLPLPAPVQKFIEAFDDHRYPSLEAK